VTSNDTKHDVLFLDDLAKVLRTSRSTIERLRRRRAFPIPELPALDDRPRWSRPAVDRFLAGEGRRGSFGRAA
jgi:hypothetical protein